MLYLHNRKRALSFLILSVFAVSFLITTLPTDAYAASENRIESRATQGKYYPLVNIPGTSNQAQGDIGSLANALFRIGIILAALLAVIMVAIGGVQYMTTDAVSGKSEGKDRIFNAVLGLILALLIWVILNEINPRIIQNLNPTIPQTQETSANLRAGQSIVTQGATFLANNISKIYTAGPNLITKGPDALLKLSAQNVDPSQQYDWNSYPDGTLKGNVSASVDPTPASENPFYTTDYANMVNTMQADEEAKKFYAPYSIVGPELPGQTPSLPPDPNLTPNPGY